MQARIPPPRANPTNIDLLNPKNKSKRKFKPETESTVPQKCLCCLLTSSVAITFILLDRIQSGKMKYLYVDLPGNEDLTVMNTNTFQCGFQHITLHCPDNDIHNTNICNNVVQMDSTLSVTNNNKQINIKESSHYQLYSYIFYILTCLGSGIPWILSPVMFFCEPKYGNKKWLGTTSQTKCFLFCLLGTITSIASVTFGTLIVVSNDCSDTLYQFIIASLGTNIQYYPTFEERDITVWFGVTLIFMIINVAITFVITVYCGNGAKHHLALKNNAQNKWFSFKVKLKSKFPKKKAKKLNVQFLDKNQATTNGNVIRSNDTIRPPPPFKGLVLSPCDEKRTKQ